MKEVETGSGREGPRTSSGEGGCSCGCGSFSLGSFIAILLSWNLNHSVLWALVHGLLGWFYVVYYVLAHGL